MEQYIFILGRDPALSKLEIESYFKSRKIDFTMLDESEIAVVIELTTINAKKVMKDLGGTQKIAKIITSFEGLYNGKENKIRYAISNYTEDEENYKDELKAYFKQEGLKATIKKSHFKESFLTPSEAQGVLEIIQYNGAIAKTVAVFDPKEQKSRDLDRPVQPSAQTTSIRLAKILINLTGVSPGQTLLDPYCGIGTIVQEAVLLGVNSIGIAFTSEDKSGSIKNLSWIRKKYNPSAKFKINFGDPMKLSRLVKKVDCVATEPYMGPSFKFFPSEGEAKKLLKQLEPKYTRLVEELSKVSKGTVVLIAPRFRTRSKKELSLTLEPIFKKNNFSFGEPIMYSSPTSRMLREIWILKPNSTKS